MCCWAPRLLSRQHAAASEALRASTAPLCVPQLHLPPSEHCAADLEAKEQLSDALYALAETINVTHPWLSPNAEELDSITFETW